MRLDRLAALSEIVSSVAIVVTLAYLAVQSRQTNEMLLGNSRQAALSTDVALLTNIIDHADAASRILGFTPEDVENQTLLIIFMRSREYQWRQFKNGTLDRETLISNMSPVASWLGGDVGSTWWASSDQAFDPEFVEFVNAWLAGEAF